MAQVGEVFKGRWALVEPLGAGSFGKTWIAQDGVTSERVVVKLLDLGRAADWKVVELFEREARVLRNLAHDGIPAYLDAFEVDGQHVLVQRLASGKPLSAWVEQGWMPEERDVVEIARQLLGVLDYLQRLNPPLVHRDIKPANVLWDREQVRLSLVDFGAVRVSRERGAAGGSTVVGTFGYMAPEQFRGKAEPATDLYGVGATMLYLLTHEDPAELPMRGLKIDVQAALSGSALASPAFVSWLERMVEPDVADRFQSASHALEVLVNAKPGEPSIYPILEPTEPPEQVEPIAGGGEAPAWRQTLIRARLTDAARAEQLRGVGVGWVLAGAGLLAAGGWLVLMVGSWWGPALGAAILLVLLFMTVGALAQNIIDPQVLQHEHSRTTAAGALAYYGSLFLFGSALQADQMPGVVVLSLLVFFALVMFYVSGGEWLHARGQARFEAASGAELPMVKDGLVALAVTRFVPGEELVFRSRTRFGLHAMWTLGLAALALQAGAVYAGGQPHVSGLAASAAVAALGAVYAIYGLASRRSVACRHGSVSIGGHAYEVTDASQLRAEAKQLTSDEGVTPELCVTLSVRGQEVWRGEEIHAVLAEAQARWLEAAARGVCMGEVELDRTELAAGAQQAEEPAFWRGESGGATSRGW